MNQKLKTALLLLLLLLLPILIIAQNTVTGVVEEASNSLPIPSATVAIKGTLIEITTDFDGNYKLNNVPNRAIIVFSYLGYITQEITYTGQNPINVSLTEKPSELETIVQIGYGSIKQNNITNTQQTIKFNNFNKGAITSLGQLIIGKTIGTQITAASGRPSDKPIISVRPGSTLLGNQNALYIIDGVPLDQNNANLNSINPNEIEDITILKDASATAIYGNRASSGVILITTKKANLNSELKVIYDVKFAIEKVDNYLDVLTSDEFRQLTIDQGRDTSILGNINTDWQNIIYQNSTRAIHNLSIEKGYKHTSIRASLGYNNEHGTLLKSGYERANLNLNVIQKLFNNKLKILLTSQLSQEKIRNADHTAISAAIIFDPTQPILSGNSSFNGFFEHTNTTGLEFNAPRNPLGLLNSLDEQLDNSQARLNINIEYVLPISGLKFISNTGLDYNEFDSHSLRDPNSGILANSQNYSSGLRRNNFLDGRFNYKKNLDNLQTQMDLTLGGSNQTFFGQSFTRGLENGTFTNFFSSLDKNSITSLFIRALFDIKDRFILSGTYSSNSSSRFSKENKWGDFYGISGGVKFTNTAFVKNSSFLSRLKLHIGLGKTGQQEVNAPFAFSSILTPEQQIVASQFGNEFVTIARPETSTNLTWETTNQWNTGLDLGFFNDRITTSLNGFYRKTSDLLLFNPMPIMPISSNIINAGSIASRGIETSINLKILEKENMSWNMGGNITFQKTKITDLAGTNNEPIQVGSISGGTGNNIQEWTIGSDPTTFHVFRQVYDNEGNPLNGVYMDVNGDNIINDLDRVRYKKANHDAYFGLSTSFTCKKFDLSATLRGATGGYIYNNNTSNTANFESVFPTNTQNPFYNNAPSDILETGFSNQELFSDYYVQKADFIKLDNLSLGYNFSGNTINMRASITGTNLFTITDYDGVDPEVLGGIDNSLFPRNRGIVLGLKFDF